MVPGVFYAWVGGSCDYNSPEREGGGAYILEQENKVIDSYAVSAEHTTEFRMMLTVMLRLMQELPDDSEVVFLTNVSYVQNFDRAPSDKAANADLIIECIRAKQRHRSVTVKVVSFHKYPELPETHRMARSAMSELRKERCKAE